MQGSEWLFEKIAESCLCYLFFSRSRKITCVLLFLQAYEERDPPALATVDVIILVNDVNDNRPTFKKDHYTFSVKENAPIGFALNEQFSAVDADIEVGF